MDGNILFVDDDSNLLGAYRRQFRKLYNVDTAQSPDEGLAALASHAYAIVVSDMRMPGMNGLQFLARAYTVSPLTMQVILTGDSGATPVEKAKSSEHIFRILQKPCSRESLTKCLAEAFVEHTRISNAAGNGPPSQRDQAPATLPSTSIA